MTHNVLSLPQAVEFNDISGRPVPRSFSGAGAALLI